MRVHDGIIGKRVQANWGAGGGQRAKGVVIGYRTEPTVIIELASGAQLHWAASLTELVEPTGQDLNDAYTDRRDVALRRCAYVFVWPCIRCGDEVNSIENTECQFCRTLPGSTWLEGFGAMLT